MTQILKTIFTKLNPVARCRKYNLSLWQCPQFLFLIMGVMIIGVILVTYFIATLNIDNPSLVSLIVLVVGGALLVIDYIITRSFERLAEASRLKTEFVGIVSHQLKSPITNLKYALETIISEQPELKATPRFEYFQVLQENIKRMFELVRDLLTVSKIEGGGLSLKQERVSLEDITKKVVLDFKPLAEASNVKVRLKVKPGIPSVLGDPLWVEQIVKNLVDNAIRYIEGEGEVVIKIQKQKNKVYFEIKDNGIGVPEPDQKLIFKRFFRSDSARLNQTQGSGLGLHITKRVLEMMGGKIWFKSRKGKGSTFYFTLPIK